MRAPLVLFAGLGALALMLFASSAQAARRRNEEWDSAAEQESYAANEVTYEMPPKPTPQSFASVLKWMLPDNGGIAAHITGTFDEMRGTTMHRAIDFNYEGGQRGLNMQFPPVFSPVDGEVTFSGGQYGTVKIEDANGFSHEFLHLQDRVVSQGQRIAAGDQIGTMGGRGPNSATQYARHVHYQLKDTDGNFIDPAEFWNAA